MRARSLARVESHSLHVCEWTRVCEGRLGLSRSGGLLVCWPVTMGSGLRGSIKGSGADQPDPGEDGTYSADDTERIFQLVLDDGVLNTINYNPARATSLMKMTTLKVIRFCRDITK